LTLLEHRPSSGAAEDGHVHDDGGFFVTVGGMRIRVSRRGAGQPILFIGGLGNNIDLWSPMVEHLSPGFETISVDGPGMGRSSTPIRPLSMAELADFYASLIRTLGLERVTVCGLSFGGAVAQHLAYQFPSLVSRLVLCGTGPGIGGVPGSPVALAELAMPWRYYVASRLRKVAPLIYGGRMARDSEALEQHVQDRLNAPPSVLGYYYQLAALAGWSSLPWLAQLTPPTLVIAGDADPVFPLENAFILGRLIPDARVEVLESAGHMFVVDSAAQVAPLIASFARA